MAAAKRRRVESGLCCLVPGKSCGSKSCGLHQWTRQKHFFPPDDAKVSLSETYKRLMIELHASAEAPKQKTTDAKKVKTLAKAGVMKRSLKGRTVRLSAELVSDVDRERHAGVLAVSQFMALISDLGTAPWANQRFATNLSMIRRLAASHLPIIVGKKIAVTHRETLVSFIDSDVNLTDARNTIWITNRQQGKTTTLGKFIAALAIYSPKGGLVSTIYSTNLDRAVELIKAAKQYINWYKSVFAAKTALASALVYTRDNERSFTLRTHAGSENEIAARPRSVDSCRGDAPASAFFDEAAFMSENFWYQFAYPLLQVKDRIFTCTTTPPPPDNYFAEFAKRVKEANERGETFFYLINHSLACSECAEKNLHHDCTHQLYLIPPWKSLLRMTQMEHLVPSSQRQNFQAEVYGVCHKQQGSYFRDDIIQAFVKRTRIERFVPQNDVVYFTIDPASHQKSEMGLVATALTNTGQTVVLGLGAVNVARYETLHIQALITRFVRNVSSVLAHVPSVRRITAVPIVECNNNDIIALSIVNAFKQACTAVRKFVPNNPFTDENFSKNITPGIGVWTTQANKLAGVLGLQEKMMDGSIVLSKQLASVTREAVASARASALWGSQVSASAKAEEAVKTLAEQLGRIRDDPKKKGHISGKTLHGDNDDLAIALIIADHWSKTLRMLSIT
jgi:hypothetical protein